MKAVTIGVVLLFFIGLGYWLYNTPLINGRIIDQARGKIDTILEGVYNQNPFGLRRLYSAFRRGMPGWYPSRVKVGKFSVEEKDVPAYEFYGVVRQAIDENNRLWVEMWNGKNIWIDTKDTLISDKRKLCPYDILLVASRDKKIVNPKQFEIIPANFIIVILKNEFCNQ